ncbi:MAG: hypothetical protein ACM3H8_08095 [Sphingobacteriales bacterium]
MNWKFKYIAYHTQLMLLFISISGGNFSYGLQPVKETVGDNYFQNLSLSKLDDKIIISWSITPAQQNVYYEVERAGKLMKFKTVGILFPEENKSASGNYIFKDNLKGTGKTKIIYYRIKQVKANGEAIFSSIKSLYLKEYKAGHHSAFINRGIHNYSYCEEKQLQKNGINNKVAGILRNIFVSINKNYTTKSKFA